MLARLALSFLYAAPVLISIFWVWWTDDEVAARRRAWLDAHLPAWVYRVPEALHFCIFIAALVGVPSALLYGVWAWLRWVVVG